MTKLSPERKHEIKEKLLLASHFREVLSSFYITANMVRLWHSLSPEMPHGAVIRVNGHFVSGKLLQDSLIACDLFPPETRNILGKLVYLAVKDQSALSMYQLLEEDREGEEAPLSLKHVYSALCRSENISQINELVGNAENNLKTVKILINELWEESGKKAHKAFRNPLVHSRANLSDPNSETYRQLVENEEGSMAFYDSIKRAEKILIHISKTCFGEPYLPTEEEHWQHILGNEEHYVWCFNEKYESLLTGHPIPKLTLPRDWQEKYKKEK